MAKNYTMTEVANIFAEKTDFEAMSDIGKRYPLLAIKMTALATKAPDEMVDIFSYMPDYLSANKVNKAIKDGGEDVSDSDVEDDETEAPAEKPTKKPVTKAKAAPKAKADADGKDYDSMNNKQMYDLLGELGERKACKAEFGDLSKASMTAYLKKHHGDGAAEVEDEAEEEVGKYDGKKAPELYALCKKRGIKAEPKKTAKYYIDLLEKADAEEAEEEPEDDDWGDEAEAEDEDVEADADDDEWKEPEEKPKKKAGRPKKAATKPVAKKATKKVEEEADDDDDDWDI